MIRATALCLVLLAGCATGNRPTTDADACARQANDDPAVQELIVKGAGSPVFEAENQSALHAARQDATVACLRARGVIPPGGVERQKRL